MKRLFFVNPQRLICVTVGFGKIVMSAKAQKAAGWVNVPLPGRPTANGRYRVLFFKVSN
jgi:hypothetical protein